MTLEKWGKDLVEQYFHMQDKNLVEQLIAQFKAIKTREELSRITGIKNKWVLQKLMDLGVQPQMMMVLTLVPLLEVAWADGHISKEERELILKEASKTGIAEGTEAYMLLSSLLETKPENQLFTSWNVYVEGVCNELSANQIVDFKNDVLARAKAVAEASGGILGIGKVSKSEKLVLEKLEAPFR
jgi:tellurite resistance protein